MPLCYSSLNTNWRCTIKRKVIFSLLSLALILALIIPTGCVPKKTTTESTPASEYATKAEVQALRDKLASLPAPSGDYDEDIAALQEDIAMLQEDIDALREELYDTLAEVDATLAEWEEKQATTNTATSAVTRWSVDAFVDADNVDVLVECSKTIKEEDDYTIWLYLTNTSDIDIPIKEIGVTFSPKSGDRVIVDTEAILLENATPPYWDWDIGVKTRKTDGTCVRIDADADVRYTLPVPDKFDNEGKPVPESFKLTFELVYE